ncbi:pirin family protein [Morganella morganii subsp. sibonii]
MTDKNAVLPRRISARIKDVGGVPVSRVLPVKERRQIGAWCFLDHAGPAVFEGDDGMKVGPHPHIGLQTFTWMLEGEVLHRDSLGLEQIIRPGQVNLMTAGRGITHTEDSAGKNARLHAAQLWIALPPADSTVAPRFDHYPELPVWHHDQISFTLLTGEYGGRRSPVLHFSPLIGMDLLAQQETTTTLDTRPDFEYGIFVLEGRLTYCDEDYSANELVYAGEGLSSVTLTLMKGTRLLLLGGTPVQERIMMWWNFVGYDTQTLQQAVSDWNNGDIRFGTIENEPREPLPAPQYPVSRQ